MADAQEKYRECIYKNLLVDNCYSHNSVTKPT